MKDEEGLFWLNDRIEKIKQINKQYDLENNSYLSFSGGSDSTCLHYLLDIALPNNKIPRIYINTGIEYNDVRKFVFDMSKKDCRIKIINSNVNIKNMLEKYGYPFKSKEHSLKLAEYKNGSRADNILKYKGDTKGGYNKCPKKLLYQYEDSFNLKISNKCCYKLKKEVFKKYEKENNKNIALTGMRSEEGGHRKNMGCIIFAKGKIKKFHPLMPMNSDWLDWFMNRYNIKLCKLYYPPYNFERTGCKGCPYDLNLQKDLDTMEKLLPLEKRQCEFIWKPVYEEYRRIGYRLRKKGQLVQTTIFDFMG